MAFGPSGELLASGSWDYTAVVWDLSDGEKIAEFHHDGCVRSVAFSPDGKYLATGVYNNIAVWDVHDGRKVVEFQHHGQIRSVSFSPDGKYLATGSHDMTAVVWDVSDGREIAEFHCGESVSGRLASARTGSISPPVAGITPLLCGTCMMVGKSRNSSTTTGSFRLHSARTESISVMEARTESFMSRNGEIIKSSEPNTMRTV